MTLEVLPGTFAVCQLTSLDAVELRPFTFLSVTGDEISLVCLEQNIPAAALRVEAGWRALRVRGTLDFSLTGILAGIAGVLSEAGISLFALSTYDTDYVLVRDSALEAALCALQNAHYAIHEQTVPIQNES